MRDGTPVGRRVVLGVAGLGALAVLAGDRLSELEQRVLAVVGPRDPTGLTQLIPAGAGFRFYSVTGSVPRRDPAAVRVAVGGLVRRPATLSLADLAALPQHTVPLPIACVEGWSADAEWTGVVLTDLVAAVGGSRDSDVRMISLEPPGPYSRTVLPARHARDAKTLIALKLNGQTLDLDHGYPCRLIAPTRPGVLQTKWLSRIEVVP
jgi:DMSO/TMAO reductase YedYZ molybdopterin-dependent catalytic subunit